MSWIIHDPDEWKAIFESKTYGTYPGTDIPFGASSMMQRRRTPEEVARIKTERRRLDEDEILRRADAIRAQRMGEATP